MSLSLIVSELRGRPGRTLLGSLSLAVGLAVFLALQAYATGYREAARAPLTEIGADVIVQAEGDRPETFEGAVFPHSTAPLTVPEMERIASLEGVESVAGAMFFWSFQDDDLVVALGIEPGSDVGPARLETGLLDGRFLRPGDGDTAVLDASYAAETGSGVGDTVTVSGRSFEVVGTVDTSRAGQIANANVYLPLSAAQETVYEAPAIQEVHDLRPDDVNMAYVRAHPAAADTVAEEAAALLGEDALVTTPGSFDEVLGGTFALVDRFGALVGAVALLLAGGALLRVVLSNLLERRRDVAVLRAVGWTRSALRAQLVGESTAVAALGTALGMLLAVGATAVLGRTEVMIPVPWELSPTPHFAEGGAEEMGLQVPLEASLHWQPLLTALGAGLAIAVLSAIAAARRAARIKPTEVWRED